MPIQGTISVNLPLKSNISDMIRFIFIIFLFLTASTLKAQEIQFGQYGSYTMTLQLGAGDLDFGQVIPAVGGAANLYVIELADAKQIEIQGVKYLDVFVDIMASDLELIDDTCTGECTIPFQLQAAFSNTGFENNSISNAQLIPVSNNMASVRFPILQLENQPPGPPPAPPTEAFNQDLVNETAVLYLYGSIDVGNIQAGEYRGTIDITVSYE
jgi:hypothetical protein